MAPRLGERDVDVPPLLLTRRNRSIWWSGHLPRIISWVSGVDITELISLAWGSILRLPANAVPACDFLLTYEAEEWQRGSWALRRETDA